MNTPISNIASRVIGTVESVSPDEIKVLLNIESPRSVSLNAGIPTLFPRINSYVLIPNESGMLVGLIVWLGVEKSQYPKRQGFKDFGLIDLPFPLRKMSLCPIGTISLVNENWKLERGIQSFPSVGDSVILPVTDQTLAIVTGNDSDSIIPLGTCPNAHGATVSVDPDKLFGRHLAVLGNTGSGKSCTLASLIRSAVESSLKENDHPNMRFIILDPNGEYSQCFSGLGDGCRVFKVPPVSGSDINEFKLPAWMWNSSEWASIAQAAPRTQRPLLQEALRNLRSGKQMSMSIENRLIARCKALKSFLTQFMGTGAIGFPNNKNCGQQISCFHQDINSYDYASASELKSFTKNIALEVQTLLRTRSWSTATSSGFNDFADTEIELVISFCDRIISYISPENIHTEINEDTPISFDIEALPDYLEVLASQEGGNAAQFISTLLMRIRMLLSDTRMNSVTNPSDQPTLEEWLENNIGKNNAQNGQISVIDLSLVPYEILHLVIAVASRITFEALQRYHKQNQKNLPTVLVLEEAHTFVAKRLPRGDDIPSPADMCRQTFERIAREGRKFGLGLVLSSQRPSELSETVLAQCNSFLLHRITNDRDQELISRLVPDTARGLLRELPSLPRRYCILLGCATQIPVLLKIRELDEKQRPKSDDPDFWSVWTGKKPREIDWNQIVNNWQGNTDGSEIIDKK
ncbi:MAG: ATP-binding protein [Bacteroidales bacterium]|nr:ATP-binding protein [Bacteroidales bacterium]